MHHTFTNIDDVDADIIQTKLLRLAPSQQKWAVHKYQHFYCLFLYGVSYFSWIYLNDFEKYFRQKVHKTEIKGFSIEEKFVFWLSKLNYILLYLAIPLWFVGLKALIGLLIAGTACGIMLGMVFQLAHIVEKTEFEDATQGDLMVENEWAKHQFSTTANFAVKNVFLTHIVGGLNFQVEHHIFPKISHVHYHDIQPIVQAVCERFGVKYRQYSSISGAVISHFARMKQLGSM